MLEAPVNSWALLHSYDSRLEGLLRAQIARVLSKKYWLFDEFLNLNAKFDMLFIKSLLHYNEFLINLRKYLK